ncbi:MAG: glycoside hydrolase [Lachnospiraceae bacterium]|nr:glycoside hydrolase [Lachnospiraceae bacterium]
MKGKNFIIRVLMICIAILGVAAIILGVILASRYIYDKSFNNKDNESTQADMNTDSETTDEISTEETTEETTEITTEEITEATPIDAEIEKDVTPPVILILNNEPQIKQWDSFDIHKYIGYADDIDKVPVLEVSGEVDTSALGTYPLKLKITDNSGNVTTADMNVKIVSEIEPSTPRPSYDFDDFISTYKNSATEVGIDVSRWQDDIDFNQVKEAGCEFVIIRIGGYDDGSVYVDSKYYNNIKNAKAAGLKVGIYYHAEESSISEVKENVKWLMGVLDGEKLDYPIAYDWEDFLNFENYEMSLQDINDIYKTFYDEVTSYGYEAMLYSSKNFLLCLWTNEFDSPIWLAHYTDRTDYTGDYIMWQQGNTGRIPGITGDVDFNVLYLNR